MAINRATRSRPLIQAEDGWLESIAGRSRHGTVLDEVVERERDESVREAVAELDEIDREALVRHEWGGQSLLEMALALDVPLGTVKRRRNSARKRLRLKLVNRAKRDRAYCRAIQGS